MLDFEFETRAQQVAAEETGSTGVLTYHVTPPKPVSRYITVGVIEREDSKKAGSKTELEPVSFPSSSFYRRPLRE